MQRTRLTIAVAALFAAMPLLHAQNNPYQIHDSCYVYMVKADALIGREIATKMGGKVYLDTAYTGGSRFVFAVPLS